MTKATMRFIDLRGHGSSEVLFVNEGAIPKPKENELLIQVKAAGVNRPDLAQREGKYPAPAGSNPILGLEVAGLVAEQGSHVTQFKVGDPVTALTNGGGYAQYCTVPEGQCLPIPEGLSFEEAASLPEVYFTVWGNLFMRTKFFPGETLLIEAGASGIGSCAILLAKAFGARVITTVSSAEKETFCLGIGADQVINYQREDLFALLKEQGVDLILDILGGKHFETHIALLKEEGRLIQIAYLQGPLVSLSLSQLLSKRLTLLGSTLRAQSLNAKAAIAKQLLKHVWPLFKTKTLRPLIGAKFSFTDVQAAHELLEKRSICGKIILQVH